MSRGEGPPLAYLVNPMMGLSQTAVDTLFDAASPPAGRLSGDVGAARGSSAPAEPDGAARRAAADTDLRRILGLSVPVAAVLAERDMTIGAILEIAVGTIIEFDAPFDSDLALQAADRLIGYGQAVKVGEHFGIRVTRIGGVRDRIDALRGP